MKVIAVATTQPKEELAEADEIVDDYRFWLREVLDLFFFFLTKELLYF
jgi:hypothetical protein